MNIANLFENGAVLSNSHITQVQDINLTPHPKFKGVYLKHLVTGKMTNNQISCHLVKVDPFCILDTHTHENELEIHEILFGEGTCYIDKDKVNYTPGNVAVIKATTPHKVVAGEKGIYILAKFTPALL